MWNSGFGNVLCNLYDKSYVATPKKDLVNSKFELTVQETWFKSEVSTFFCDYQAKMCFLDYVLTCVSSNSRPEKVILKLLLDFI